MDRKELIYKKCTMIFLVLSVVSLMIAPKLVYAQGNENEEFANSADFVDKFVTSLANGTMIVVAPNEMKLGSTYDIIVRIYSNLSQNTILYQNANIIEISDINEIRTSQIMGVDLTGESFNISPISDETQLLTDSTGNYAEWKWIVTPKKAGIHSIAVHTYVILKTPSAEHPMQVLSYQKSIKVTEVNILAMTISQFYYLVIIFLILGTITIPMYKIARKRVERWRHP